MLNICSWAVISRLQVGFLLLKNRRHAGPVEHVVLAASVQHAFAGEQMFCSFNVSVAKTDFLLKKSINPMSCVFQKEIGS